MGQPIWSVRNSNLGTIAENLFFEYVLEAIDTDLGPVSYSLIAGELPEGIQLTGTQIAGTPIKITGNPADVDVDTSSRFSIRATTTTNEVSDRTFTLLVSGQKVPQILTTSGLLDDFYYGEYVDIEIEAIDEDAGQTLTWEVASGSLPAGLFLIQNDRSCFIRGYPLPVSALPSGTVVGYAGSKFDEDLGAFGFDYAAGTIDKNYEFVLSVTDSFGFDSRTYSIFLKSKFNLTADNTEITADQLDPTADITPKINPILLNEEGSIGTYLHDNNFAYQFFGFDFESEIIEFVVSSGTIPPSLTLDAESGWLHGTIDPILDVEELFIFDIVTRKVAEPDLTSQPKTFAMTITGDTLNALTFLNPPANPYNTPYIMCLDNGSVSELAIIGVVTFETELIYTLAAGQLPDGLILTSTGLIVGRPKFQHFTLDGGATTIDGGPGPNTSCANLVGSFDNSFTFTVNVVDEAMTTVDEDVEFTIIVAPTSAAAWEDLYIVNYSPIPDRIYFNQLADQESVVPAESVYRTGDPYFGIAPDLRFLLADGLTGGSTITVDSTEPTVDQSEPTVDIVDDSREKYAVAMSKNHNTKQFGFGDLKIAGAYIGDTLIYELIYADVVDPAEEDGVSVVQELILANVDAAEVIRHGGIPTYNALGSLVVYPASLINMRNRILDGIGQVGKDTLPLWMTSSQPNGRTLGFIPAVPIVYCNPGEATQILFNIVDSGFDLKLIGFEADRYVWDHNMTNHNLVLGQTEADYDGVAPNGAFVGGDADIGTPYVALDTITLANGAEILVEAVDGNGDVTEFTITVIGSPVSPGVLIAQDTSSGTGIGFTLTPGQIGYEAPDEGDELLKFPKDNVFA